MPLPELYDVFQHVETGERIFYKHIDYKSKELQSSIRFNRRIRNAVKIMEFTKFLTLTYNKEFYPPRPNDIRRFLESLSRLHRSLHNTKISYIWKLEQGSKGRLHYHVLLKMSYIHKSLIAGTWGKGFIKIQEITDKQKAQAYVSKYMTKVSTCFLPEGLRRFSTSRDIPSKKKSDYKYVTCVTREGLGDAVVMHNEFLE